MGSQSATDAKVDERSFRLQFAIPLIVSLMLAQIAENLDKSIFNIKSRPRPQLNTSPLICGKLLNAHILLYTNKLTLRHNFLTIEFFTITRDAQEQSGAVEACWAHNPEVQGSKPCSANFFLIDIIFASVCMRNIFTSVQLDEKCQLAKTLITLLCLRL